MSEGPTGFRFTNYRPIPGADYDDDEAWAAPWLKREDFSPADLSQLEDILQEWSIAGDPFSITCDKFEGLAEVGFDRWDVVDAAGQPAYTIWSYTDSGMIYRFGTTERVGQIIQWDAEFDDEALGEALEAARLEEKARNPSAPLPDSLKP